MSDLEQPSPGPCGLGAGSPSTHARCGIAGCHRGTWRKGLCLHHLAHRNRGGLTMIDAQSHDLLAVGQMHPNSLLARAIHDQSMMVKYRTWRERWVGDLATRAG